MKRYLDKLVEEKRVVEVQAIELSKFIGYSPNFDDIPVLEQELMREQCEIMFEYSGILGKRIVAFIQNNHKINEVYRY